jgi:hypothetical protein
MIKTVATIICFAYLVLVAGSGSASVICLGDDGHVAIEMGRGGTCAELNHENSPDCQLSEVPHCHCGPCIDIPFGTELVEAKQASIERLVLQTNLLVPLAVVGNAPNYIEQATISTFPIPPPIYHNQYLLSLRTIVLLI